MRIALYTLAGIGAASLGFAAWCCWIGWQTRRAFGLDRPLVRYRRDPWTGHLQIDAADDSEATERLLRIAAHPGAGNPASETEMRRLLGGSWKW